MNSTSSSNGGSGTARAVVIGGYQTDAKRSLDAFNSTDARLRELALGALERSRALDDEMLALALDDPAPNVRRRAVEIAANRPTLRLLRLLDDPDPSVVEAAAWAAGERSTTEPDTISALIDVATSHSDPLCREGAIAALGAIGDPTAIPTLIAASRRDKPAVRRRAVIALAPFDRADVDEALHEALTDRDRQVRQAAADLLQS